MNQILANWIVARLHEPSTWGGAGVISLVIHQIWPGVLGDNILNVAAAFGGVIAILMSEKKV
jgi:drug/metabolite transporter superfamily protein YnfA